ncbi:MAG: 2-succinyl-5-enolpyruvyl-6-hydroxy-3-cyclohexene-1-carboxylic-acid synthase [Bacteroidaceae bacterium]|nr:2-succinyl-5-enolpyruvyl-6-hydroxy-3-cyclohexene-1-carboxylic-acid synthase [Bacteroidaceae bacterium]
MYSDNKMVIHLISLLKQFNIRRIVISPGSRHFALVHSLEADPYFKLYSVVDERSAAFFALGLIQQSGEVVAVTCSSGTACMNYGSAIVEAYYQRLPLLVLSSDRIPELLNQLEDQMYDQLDTFTNCTKYHGQLPVIKSEIDEWFCNRIINEAFIELTHHGKGPVHLNIPFVAHNTDTFSNKELPLVRKIGLTRYGITPQKWQEQAEMLKGKKVMIVWGQSCPMTQELKDAIDIFTDSFDAIILTDKISNCSHKNAIKNTTAVLGIILPEERENLRPDIVITIGANYIFNNELKGFLASGNTKHWQVGLEDKVCDPFHKLTEIFEMEEYLFFRTITGNAEFRNEGIYAESWIELSKLPELPTPEYNELYAIGALFRKLPPNIDLQLSNSCTIRMAHFFPTRPDIRINCNRGVNGIDGSMSTAVGFAADNERPTFYVTGDLSFFYDMNSLWIRHLSPKMRILLINNGGGAVMYAPLNEELRKTLPAHVGAGHNTSAKGWVESVGFKYVAANNKEELDKAIDILCDVQLEQPILVEVFSTINTDIDSIKEYFSKINRKTFNNSFYHKVIRKAKSILKL